MTLGEVVVVWLIMALAVSLVTYLGTRLADLLMDHHWRW